MGRFFLRTVDSYNGGNYSYLHWASHNLVMGTPMGTYAHNTVDLRPGGSVLGSLFSQFRMYSAKGENDYFLKIQLNSDGNCFFANDGNVGIGTTKPHYKLDVQGIIRAHEIRVNLSAGADFVFEPDYKLMPLNELEQFVTENKHLPEVAPAAVMEADGISVNEMNIKLLQKVEELTLYVIELNKEIQALKENNKKK